MNMTPWKDNPELEARFLSILKETQRLQLLLGVKPRTLEERYSDYQLRIEQEALQQRQLEQLRILQQQTPKRTLPKRS